VWTEDDDKEIKYGKWNRYTAKTILAEEHMVHPPKGDIWPHWSEGIPTKLRRIVWSPSFSLGPVRHRSRPYYESLELKWNDMFLLSLLKSNYRLLPGNYESEWSGVYRIFSPNSTIDRFCGKDPTGTLYIGRAGTGGRNFSNLRTRIMSFVKGEHHATNHWDFSDQIRHKYPWDSLAVEWAFTGERADHKGELFPEAIIAEKWLLDCYRDSYGEFPPLNQKR
jgi:hypothetical protein